MYTISIESSILLPIQFVRHQKFAFSLLSDIVRSWLRQCLAVGFCDDSLLANLRIFSQCALHETNRKFTPENRPNLPQKETYSVFQPSIFRCKLAVSFKGVVIPNDSDQLENKYQFNDTKTESTTNLGNIHDIHD